MSEMSAKAAQAGSVIKVHTIQSAGDAIGVHWWNPRPMYSHHACDYINRDSRWTPCGSSDIATTVWAKTAVHCPNHAADQENDLKMPK